MRNTILLFVLLFLFTLPSTVFAVGGGDVTFTLKTADPVHFSHDYHMKTRGLKCVACHYQKFSKGQGNEMKKELINKRDFCELCHNGMKGFDAGSAKNCTRCHKK
jgi:c(7)-type cytochrome triheme protein